MFFGKKVTNKTMKDCTILIQGRIDSECLNLWIKNHKNSNVVLSIWEDGDLSQFKLPKSWTIVVNQYPLVRFRKEANLDYQLISTLKGLAKIDTYWVIKVRADEYWSNIDTIYQKMLLNPEKIVTGSMFFRKWGMYKFHCSDKILGGTHENLYAMFESTLHNVEINLWGTTVPESQLGLGFVMAKEKAFEATHKQLEKKLIKEKFIPKAVAKRISMTLQYMVNTAIDISTNDLRIYNSTEPNWDSMGSKFGKLKIMVDDCLSELDFADIKPIDDKPYMQKWFEIIDINELKPYIATRNFGDYRGRVWYRDNFDHFEEDCLTDINQLSSVKDD